jgi:DnaJ family protein A protein 5
LVKFVRKRDPRFKAHLTLQAQSVNDAALNSVAAEPVVQPRRQVAEYVEQEWQKVDSQGLHDDLDWAAAEGVESQEWECVACGKTFKSEAAWNSHERSRKHLKEVLRIQREMNADDQAIRFEETDGDLQKDRGSGAEDLIQSINQDVPVAGPPSMEPSWDPPRVPDDTVTKSLVHPEAIEMDPGDVARFGNVVIAGMTKREKRRAREAKRAGPSPQQVGALAI